MPSQVAVEAETFSSAPGLRRRVLGELLQHLLTTFAGAVPEQLEGTAMAVCSRSSGYGPPDGRTSLAPRPSSSGRPQISQGQVRIRDGPQVTSGVSVSIWKSVAQFDHYQRMGECSNWSFL